MAGKREKPITERQKAFVRAIVCENMPQGKAYRLIFGNTTSADAKASSLLKKESIIGYKEKISQEIEDKAIEKALWNLEVATQHLRWLLEEARKEVEATGLTRATVLGFTNSLKELNKLYGLNNPPPNAVHLPKIIFE